MFSSIRFGGITLTVATKGVEETIKALDAMGVSTQKAVNKASSKGAATVKKSIRGEIPVRTGTLKKNLVTVGERSRFKGKKVRELTFKGGAEANALLQKPINHPGILGGENPKAYYPASMEYGYLARAKGGGVQYIEGRHFLLAGAEAADGQAEAAMIDTLTKELDKIWQSTNA